MPRVPGVECRENAESKQAAHASKNCLLSSDKWAARLILDSNNHQGRPVPKSVMEAITPGAGDLSSEELQSTSRKSCGVLRRIQNPLVPWLQSYDTREQDLLYPCGPHAELILEHACRSGFPARLYLGGQS